MGQYALDLVFNAAAALALIALPILILSWARYMKAVNRAWSPASRAAAALPVKSIAFFVVPIMVVFAVGDFATTAARQEVVDFLIGKQSDFVVSVNGQAISDNSDILSAIRTVTPYWAHHSHPTSKIRVDVRGPKGRLSLELGRDSDNAREYWVFIPGNAITSKNEIGRITTAAFDHN